jgi:cytochrome P450/NADPH-cytochrome P450 reductase
MPATRASTNPIPTPRRIPLLGHAPLLDTRFPVRSLLKLTEKLPGLCKVEMPGQTLLLVKSQRFAAVAIDDDLFEKHVHNVLRQMRPFAGMGLFTANTRSPEWANSHRAIAPAFGAKNVSATQCLIEEKANSLVRRLLRSSAPVDVPEEMTRVTLDVIGLSAFSHDFRCVDGGPLHHFLQAMGENLKIAGYRARRLRLADFFYTSQTRAFDRNTRTLLNFAEQIVSQRIALAPKSGSDQGDLLDRMLAAKLDNRTCCHQIVTMLIAGHETTGALISFALYSLAKNPTILHKLRSETDNAFGDGPISADGLRNAPYLDQVLKETMRLYPPAPTFARRSKTGDVDLPESMTARSEDVLLLMLPAIHRDPAVWGNDAEQFKPERMAREKMATLPKGSYLPFGAGKRVCIGSSMALLEASIVVAKVVRSCNFQFDQPNYELAIEETPGFKPSNLKLQFTPRELPHAH